MVRLSEEQLMALSLKTQAALAVLSAVSELCGRRMLEAEEIVPTARRCKDMLQGFLGRVDDDRYAKEMAMVTNAVDLVSGFIPEQVQRLGGLLQRVPLMVDHVVPRIIQLG